MIKTGIIDPELALRIVRESPIIAYDTETTGLEHPDYIVGYVITDWEHSVYVPVRHDGGGNIPLVDEFELALAAAFRDRARQSLRTVGHHLGFDLRMSLKTGFGGKKVPIVIGGALEDTMINESLIDDTTSGYGLDDCSRRHQVTVKKGDDLYRAIAAKFGGLPDRKSMQHFWKMPGDQFEVVDYATGDGVSTLELREAQQRYLDEPYGIGDNVTTMRKVWQLECDLLPYLARMYDRGIKVDMNYAEQVAEKIEKLLEETKAKFEPGFNVRSPTQVEALYRANGYTDADFESTAKGAVSFREKWLDGNEIGKAILSVRHVEKARDSFIKPLVSTQNYNGRIHPVLHQSKSDEYGVAGARLSCSDPNMQAFPKRNYDIGSLVRPLIVPDFGTIYEEDFQQQEPRFFTHYSEEPALLEGYRNGTMDMHDRANEIMFNNSDRDTAKRMGMGILTMMSDKTLAMHMGCTVEQASRWKSQFLTDAFPNIGRLQKEIVRVFKSRGYVKTIMGRVARLDDKKYGYRGVSRVIQNNGGDHMKSALLKLNQYEDAYYDEFQVLLSIHDSFIFQTEDPRHAREAQLLAEGVAQDLNLLVPIPVDVGWGTNWSEASYIKRKDEWRNIVSQLDLAA